MIDQFEPKQIISRDNKLFYDGREVSKEEAEEIVRNQLREFEESVAQSIFKTPDLSQDIIQEIAETVTKTRLNVANKGLKATDFDEYIDTGTDIIEAYKYSVNKLKNINIRSIERNRTEDYFSSIKAKLGWSDDREPTYRELFDNLFDIVLRELIYEQIYRQFWNTGLKVTTSDIFVSGDSFKEDFTIEIKVKGTVISFNITRNDGFMEEVTGKYIASGLKVGAVNIQTNLSDYLKYAGNNFKTAQTLDNLIKKQIRFLRTTIKQEINFSLEQNISSAEERVKLAKLYAKEYDLLMDNITRTKLDRIISSSEKLISTKNEKLIEVNNNEVVIVEEKQEDETTNIAFSIRAAFADIFNLNPNELKINLRKSKNEISTEFMVHNQKLNINVNHSGNVSVISSNYLGTGKKDINIDNVSGKNLSNKIRKAALMGYQPVLNRQIESIMKRYKDPVQRKSAKSLELLFMHSSRLLTDTEITFNEKIKTIRSNTEKILDLLINITEDVHEYYLEIFDFIIKIISEELIENTRVEHSTKIEEYKPYSTKGSLYVFRVNREEGNDIFESINEVRKKINRDLRSIVLLSLLKFYVDFEFFGEFTASELNVLEQLDLSIKKIANILSEDMVFGVISRRLLSLMSSSTIARDDLFKNSLNEIIKEIIKLKG